MFKTSHYHYSGSVFCWGFDVWHKLSTLVDDCGEFRLKSNLKAWLEFSCIVALWGKFPISTLTYSFGHIQVSERQNRSLWKSDEELFSYETMDDMISCSRAHIHFWTSAVVVVTLLIRFFFYVKLLLRQLVRLQQAWCMFQGFEDLCQPAVCDPDAPLQP